MNKTIAIHQPNYLPWIGFFYKIAKSDIFVLLDDVQYTKNSFINRNRIKTLKGVDWLSLPVIHSGKFGQLIKDVEIIAIEKSFKKITGTLNANYAKSKYFNDIIDKIDLITIKTSSLAIVNEIIIRRICDYLSITTTIIRSSELGGVEGDSTDRLVSICNKLGATNYLAGFGSAKYIDKKVFVDSGIDYSTYDFVHPFYPQIGDQFVSNLSIVDLLFNCGPSSKNYFL